jgi:hypothetical protein
MDIPPWPEETISNELNPPSGEIESDSATTDTPFVAKRPTADLP